MIRPITITNFNHNTIQLKKTEKITPPSPTLLVPNITENTNNIAFYGLFGPSKKEKAAEAKREKEAEARRKERIKAEEEAKREQYLLKLRANASHAETQRLNNEAKYIEELNKIQTEQIQPRLTDLIIRHNRGKLTEMPNCIMITCGTEEVNNDLIERTKETAECRVVTIDEAEGILAPLEEAQRHFEEQNEWTLLHIKNFTNRINPKVAVFETIEATKELMSAAAEDYHTTILFSAENPDELDEIALEPHRTHWIEGNLISAKEQNIKDAWNRVRIPEELFLHDRKDINKYDALIRKHDEFIRMRYRKYPQSVTDDIIYILENEGPYQVEKGKLKTSEDVLNHILDNFLAPVYSYKPEKPEHEAYSAEGDYNTFICNPFYKLKHLGEYQPRTDSAYELLNNYEYLPLFAKSNPEHNSPGTENFTKLMCAITELLRKDTGAIQLGYPATIHVLNLMVTRLQNYFNFNFNSQCPGEIKHYRDMYSCNMISNCTNYEIFERAKKKALQCFVEPLPNYQYTFELIKALTFH